MSKKKITDKMRLDWLQDKIMSVYKCEGQFCVAGIWDKDLRKAIDIAMKASKK